MAFAMNLADVAQMMDGHYPPDDPAQNNAYWTVFTKRAEKQLTEKQWADCLLLAGGLPDEYATWERQRQRDQLQRRSVSA